MKIGSRNRCNLKRRILIKMGQEQIFEKAAHQADSKQLLEISGRTRIRVNELREINTINAIVSLLAHVVDNLLNVIV